MKDYPDDFIALLETVTSKRPRTVIQHILKNGYITTEELKSLYGYNHPPRAARDVREYGIPLDTFWVTGTDGRKIGAYRFGDIERIRTNPAKSSGRTALSKLLKQALIEKYGAKCFVYSEYMDASVLQVDHRIPYEICGEQDTNDMEKFMLLSPSANRAKSWTCEHCINWEKKEVFFAQDAFGHTRRIMIILRENMKKSYRLSLPAMKLRITTSSLLLPEKKVRNK